MGKVQHVDVVSKHRVTKQLLPEEITVSLQEIVADAKQGLLALGVGVGLQVLETMMAEEITAIVGPKGKHNPDRQAKRHGEELGSVVLGGRRVPVVRPRARTMNDREVVVDTYRVFQDPELLAEMAFERMVAGLATRRYAVGPRARRTGRCARHIEGGGVAPLRGQNLEGTCRAHVGRPFPPAVRGAVPRRRRGGRALLRGRPWCR